MLWEAVLEVEEQGEEPRQITRNYHAETEEELRANLEDRGEIVLTIRLAPVTQ